MILLVGKAKVQKMKIKKPGIFCEPQALIIRQRLGDI